MTPLAEGVTPAGRKRQPGLHRHAAQYGDYMTITDVVMDTHEDPCWQQMTEVLGESAALTIETLRYNVLKAGTNVFYANGGVRTAVNTTITLDLQRQVTTGLLRQNAKMHHPGGQVHAGLPHGAGGSAFIGLHHPDLETDIRNMTGLHQPKQYGTVTPFENEIGAVERVRYLSTCSPRSRTPAAPRARAPRCAPRAAQRRRVPDPLHRA
jgi:N4-gp56 family major capsid protein